MSAEAPIRVLLVEDDLRLQTLGRKILERHGYLVLLASDGRVAVELAGSGQPDLPIVALTAHAMERDRDRTRDAGCDGFLSKPYQIPDLLAAVSAHLRPA